VEAKTTLEERVTSSDSKIHELQVWVYNICLYMMNHYFMGTFLQTELTELGHLTEEKAALLDQLKVEKAALLDKCSVLESQLQDIKVRTANILCCIQYEGIV